MRRKIYIFKYYTFNLKKIIRKIQDYLIKNLLILKKDKKEKPKN